MNIADRIQSLRKAKGISQEQLADTIGVSRQAVSKWESEQSMPDMEKILLMSDYFEVTTDYLLKGIEPVAEEKRHQADAVLFTLVGTVVNLIGLLASIMVWIEKQKPASVAIGLMIMAIGCMIFAAGQLTGTNKRKAFHLFGCANIWLLSLIPISCVFNAAQGIIGGYWWTFTPIPQLGNSLCAYGLCWLGYFMLCVVVDIVLIKTGYFNVGK